MAEVTAESVAKVVIRESASPGPGTVVEAARKKMADRGPEEGLKVAAGRKADRGIVKYAVNENIGTDRQPNGDKRIVALSPEATRLTTATAESMRISDYLEKGYDNIPPAEQDVLRTRVLDVCNTIPAYKTILTGMTVTEQRAFAERLLKNQKMTALVEQGILDTTDVAKIKPENITALSSEVAKAKVELDAATAKLTSFKQELSDLKTNVEEAKDQVEDPPGTGTMRPGILYQEKLTNTTEFFTLNGQVTAEQNTAKVTAAQVKAYEGELEKRTVSGVGRDVADIMHDLTVKNGELSTLQASVGAKQARMKYLQDRDAEIDAIKKEAPTKILAKQRELDQVDKEVKEKEAIKAEKDGELAKAKAARSMEEDHFVKSLENVVPDAVAKYLEQESVTATAAVQAETEAQAKKAEGKTEKDFLEQLSTHFFNGNKVDVGFVNSSYDYLLQFGPDQLIAGALARKWGCLTGDPRVTAALADNAFMDKARARMGEDILKYKMLRGGWFSRNGKARPDEILKLQGSDWGKKALEQSLAGKKDLQEKIKQATGQDILDAKGRLAEWFGKSPVKIILIILAIILGLGVVTATAVHH